MYNMKKVDTLVFEGGSVKGLAYVGALHVLDLYSQKEQQKAFLEQIQRVAGTSAGAIMALLIALGLNLSQINIIMQNTSFASFADSSWYAYGKVGKGAAIYRNGYLCEGAVFMNWVEDLLATYAGNKALTFAQLKQKTNKDLHVYAVRLNDSETVIFNAEKTPNVTVALAVRMSMSIPVFFKPVRVKETLGFNDQITAINRDELNGTTYYVDGGVKANYPYQLVKTSEQLQDEQMIGFRVDSDEEIFKHMVNQETARYLKPLYRDRTQLTGGYSIQLIPHILTALMSSQEDAHNINSAESARTIRCWDCNISTFDFNLNQEKINGLLASGTQSAKEFIDKLASTIQDFKVSQQIEAAKVIPNDELAFADRYGHSEAARMLKLTQDIKMAANSGEVILDTQDKQQLAGLKTDMQRLQNLNEKVYHRVSPKFNLESMSTVWTAKVKTAKTDDLKPAIAFLEQLTSESPPLKVKEIKVVTDVKLGTNTENISAETANIDFSSNKAFKPAQASVLDQSMFSSKPHGAKEFVSKAETFLLSLPKENLYKENPSIEQYCTELQDLLTNCRKNIKTITKGQISEIQEKIKNIEEVRTMMDQTTEKKSLVT